MKDKQRSTSQVKDKHTPGPWKLSNEGDLILDSENNVLAYLVLAYLRCTKTNGGLSAQVDANARLMAAAPKMYEFIEKLATTLIPTGVAHSFASTSILHAIVDSAKNLTKEIEGDE